MLPPNDWHMTLPLFLILAFLVLISFGGWIIIVDELFKILKRSIMERKLKRMNLYFIKHYINTSFKVSKFITIIADSPEKAVELINNEILSQGFTGLITIEDIIKFDTTKEGVVK